MSVKKLLSQDAFWMVNKKMAKELGYHASVLLSELIDKEDYFKGVNSLVLVDGIEYFYLSSGQIESSIFIGYKAQKKAIEELTKVGLIRIKLMGIPATLHFSINNENLENYFYQNGNTSIAKKVKLVLPKGQNIYKENNIKKDININTDKVLFDFSFVDPSFAEPFFLWLEHKKGKKQSYRGQTTLKTCYDKLVEDSNNNPAIAKKIIKQAIGSNWAGFFPLKENSNPSETKRGLNNSVGRESGIHLMDR
jgi:hypothetical protein